LTNKATVFNVFGWHLDALLQDFFAPLVEDEIYFLIPNTTNYFLIEMKKQMNSSTRINLVYLFFGLSGEHDHCWAAILNASLFDTAGWSAFTLITNRWNDEQ
jgi:hypothetical protein